MMSSHKIARRLALLQNPHCHARQRGLILKDFLCGKMGILSIEHWFQLYCSFSNFYVRKKILIGVRNNIRDGHVSGKDKIHLSPYKEFIGKAWPRMK